MRLDDERASENVEDRRGRGGGGFSFPGGGGRRRVNIPIGRRSGGLGIGGIILVLIASYIFGFNPMDMINGNGGGFAPRQQGDVRTEQFPGSTKSGTDDKMAIFTRKVLGTTERTWDRMFREKLGRKYQPPVLVMFERSVQSACGHAQSAMGPFYCPADKKVYIDLSFYADMTRKLGAPGDFAQAYVIAHEVGHHVQNLLGISNVVSKARQRVSKTRANALSVLVELQADCFSGIWARDNRKLLEKGDIEEGLNAASAIGDDRLQRRSQGYVVPESFTHGTSAQRVAWFKRGMQATSLKQCDTFSAR